MGSDLLNHGLQYYKEINNLRRGMVWSTLCSGKIVAAMVWEANHMPTELDVAKVIFKSQHRCVLSTTGWV